MDDIDKLAERLARHAIGAVNELEDDLLEAVVALLRLRDELETVRADRDIKATYCAMLDDYSAAADMIAVEREAWKARALSAERQRDAAREALRPFARAYSIAVREQPGDVQAVQHMRAYVGFAHFEAVSRALGASHV